MAAQISSFTILSCVSVLTVMGLQCPCRQIQSRRQRRIVGRRLKGRLGLPPSTIPPLKPRSLRYPRRCVQPFLYRHVLSVFLRLNHLVHSSLSGAGGHIRFRSRVFSSQRAESAHIVQWRRKQSGSSIYLTVPSFHYKTEPHCTSQYKRICILLSLSQSQDLRNDFVRNILWTFEDIHMLVGSNMPIFGGGRYPAVSLRLRLELYIIWIYIFIWLWMQQECIYWSKVTYIVLPKKKKSK